MDAALCEQAASLAISLCGRPCVCGVSMTVFSQLSSLPTAIVQPSHQHQSGTSTAVLSSLAGLGCDTMAIRNISISIQIKEMQTKKSKRNSHKTSQNDIWPEFRLLHKHSANASSVIFCSSTSCSEEQASRAPSAWTFQKRRDFAQSLLEDNGRNRRRTLSCHSLTCVSAHPAKKQKLWRHEIKTQNVGRAL